MSFYQTGIIALLLLVTSCVVVHAQQDNRRCHWVSASARILAIDSNEYVLSNSLFIADSKAQHPDIQHLFNIRLDSSQNSILITKRPNTAQIRIDSILICYRVLPKSLSHAQFNRSKAGYDTGYYSQYNTQLPITQKPSKSYQREELFSIKGIGTDEELQKTGSLSRGVSFGNGSGQDVGVVSSLNLQLEGKLTPDLLLTAAITDQNVPFQPEGNTQQLQDFDQVLIQLKHKKGLLEAGDIVLQNDSASYFLKYFKNVQGAQIQAHFTDSSKWKSSTSIGISAAKGQFHSDSIAVLEGVQGPYRLRGANNERFITILANSERVFLDGKRLERGFDFDYIIDYNTAEITFNNHILITQFSRVRVDFEYATQNYSRSILQAQHSQQYKKWGIRLGVYREKDNINSPLLAQLSEQDREVLSLAGDEATLAVAPAITPVNSFDANQILYTITSTEIDGISYTFYERATDEDETLFSITFSEVGLGNGNYIAENPTANGREYRWVAPINGVPQGSFEPIRQLPAPNQRQLFTIRAHHQLNKTAQIYLETAFSNQDQNLFSTIDSQDDKGYAVKVGYLNEGKKSKRYKDYEWFSGLSLELNAQHFKPIDRFRSIEFDRDWALENRLAQQDQIAIGFIGLKKDEDNRFEYQLSHRQRDNAADGLQHRAALHKTLGKLSFNNDFFLLHSNRDTTTAQWTRLHSTWSWNTDKVILGYDFSLDDNQILRKTDQSVLRTIMNFKQHQAFIQNGDSLASTFRLDYTYRTDFAPIQGILQKNTISQTTSFNYKNSKKSSLLSLTATYRTLEHLQINNQKEETIMGRFDWKKHFLKKRIRSNFTLSTAAGRELRRAFFYLPVDVGQGTHTWRDDNGDGVQDLNEFYEAINLEERQYAKFFQPTDEYLLAFNTLMNYQLHLQSPKAWAKSKGIKAILAKFSSITAIRVNKRTTDQNPLKRLLPFSNTIADEDLLSNRSSVRNTIFYNRRNPKFGAEFFYLATNNKQLLTAGFQENNTQESRLNFRFALNKKWSSEISFSNEQKQHFSDLLSNQNLDIQSLEFHPTLSYQPTKRLRLSGNYHIKHKQNASINQERAVLNEFAFNLRFAQKVRNALNCQIQLVHINFEGETNTGVGYALLEALQPGTNLRWEIRWSQRLNNGLQLTALYNGRKSEGNAVIHFSRVQATALF